MKPRLLKSWRYDYKQKHYILELADGLKFHIGFGLVCAFGAVMLGKMPVASQALLIVDGICLGLGKPLLSGSIEAFYQNVLAEQLRENPHEA